MFQTIMNGRTNDTVIVRKNISNLGNELSPFRTAMDKFMAIRDNRGYNQIAGFHGAPDWWCWHHEESSRSITRAHLFLPWHRAYLKWFEDHLRDHDKSVSQCWWDWTSDLSHNEGMPRAYTDETVDAELNPLYKFHMTVLAPTVQGLPDITLDEDTVRNPDSPNDLPEPSRVKDLYTIEDFGQFSTAIEEIHDEIHMWCHGSMGRVSTAAYDPIFYAHHCNIDRIWSIWQNTHGNSTMPPDLLDISLAPFPYTVKHVLKIYDLGYEYATSSSEVKL